MNQDQTKNIDVTSVSEHCDAGRFSDVKRPSVIDKSDLIYDMTFEGSTMGIELHDTLVEDCDSILLS